ncbi:hypothetical protein ABFV55_27515, partial [Pseudomonas syringae]|uniref:hypothetical protein n=1 Tax=Pseudomonas syringae TaxID=317 RepID=UPI0034D97018
LQHFLCNGEDDFDIDKSIDEVNSILESVPLPSEEAFLEPCSEVNSVELDDQIISESLIPTPPPPVLKPLLSELKYIPLDSDGSHPVIILATLD